MNHSSFIVPFLVAQFSLALGVLGGSASPNAFTYNSFSQTNGIQFNGSAVNVTTPDGPVLQLTSANANRAGSAFTADPVALSANHGFSTFFTFRLSQPSGLNSGSGISFTIQNAGPSSLGSAGSGLGYGGITNSLAVVFDTGSAQGNQLAVRTNGGLSAVASATITNASLNDGNICYAWIDYDGVRSLLEARLTQQPVRPSVPDLATVVDLPALLSDANLPAVGNLLINGGFEDEPNWGKGVSYDGSETALTGNDLPGWTIEPKHAVTIHKHPGAYLTINGSYSLNPDGEGWNGVSTTSYGGSGHNANFYQDFESARNLNYTLSFNWQSWGLAYPPTTNHFKISVTDTATGAALFTGLYRYDGNGTPHPVHAVTGPFPGTGNRLRLRIEESPESGYNDNTFMVDDFKVVAEAPLNTRVGFTGGTSASGSQQDILSWKFAATPTLRMSGVLVLTNTPPGFTLTNGILVRQMRYAVNSVWYTNKYLYPLTFAAGSNSTVAFTSPAGSGLVPGPNGQGQESASILATYGWPARAAGLDYRPASISPNPFTVIGLVVDLPSRSGPSPFLNMDLNSFSTTFPGIDISQIMASLANAAQGGGSSSGSGSPPPTPEEFSALVNVLSPILRSPSAGLMRNVTGTTFGSLFPGPFHSGSGGPILGVTEGESEVMKQVADIASAALSDILSGTVRNEIPEVCEALSSIVVGGAQLDGDSIPVDVPKDSQPLIESVQQLLNLFNTPVEAEPDYAFDMVSCSEAANIGFMTVSKQVTSAPASALELLSPRTTGDHFSFNFLTVSNQTYTVWSSPNVITDHWASYTNFTANGFSKVVKVPSADSRGRYFRVSSP
jgi:hypothetical protein